MDETTVGVLIVGVIYAFSLAIFLWIELQPRPGPRNLRA